MREYLFNIVLGKLIKSTFAKSLWLDELVSYFVGSIENKEEYVVNIKKYFLYNMNPDDKKEADVQTLFFRNCTIC